jgi:hypothetical protein
MTAARIIGPAVLLACVALAAAQGQPKKKKPEVGEKEFRRACVLLLEDPLGESARDCAKLILTFTSKTPRAAVVLGKEEVKWFGEDKERALLLFAAYVGGNASAQLHSGVKRNDRYSGLLYLFQVYRVLQGKDERFKNPAVEELLKMHREDRLVKHLQELEQRNPSKLSPEDEKAIEKLKKK